MEHEQAERIAKLAETKLNMRLGVRRELRKLTELLGEGEEVLNLARGQYDGKTGLLFVTDRRVVFTEQGMMRSRLEDFPYERISSVQTETGAVFGKVTIFASGNKAKIERVAPKERVPEIGDYVRTRLESKAATSEPASAAAAPAGGDVMDQLERLGKLRDAGVISEDEFTSKKAELLARL
jgi:PH (Pleckstrin Homology) domain-containing protein/putative oligomerization/nucleic acid binding protein